MISDTCTLRGIAKSVALVGRPPKVVGGHDWRRSLAMSFLVTTIMMVAVMMTTMVATIMLAMVMLMFMIKMLMITTSTMLLPIIVMMGKMITCERFK